MSQLLEAALRMEGQYMKRFLGVAALVLSILAPLDAAIADELLPGSALTSTAYPDEQADTGKTGVLCAFWFVQRAAERTGWISQSETSIADVAYPVPAPVWIAQNFFAAAG